MTSTRFCADDDSQSQSTPNSQSSTALKHPTTMVTTTTTITTTTTHQWEQPTASIRRVLRLYEIHAPHLFDSLTRELVRDRVVYIDRDRGVILGVCQKSEAEIVSVDGDRKVEVEKIEMGEGTILVPGFVDVHVHSTMTDLAIPVFLHPYSETTWEDQVTRESLAERTVRATAHARKTIQAGFTTVRDLGTEGAFDADIALRKCMAGRRPIIPGPRYYCSTRAIVATGAYGPKNRLYPAQDGVDGAMGAVPVNGVDACVREVRRQIGAGADWIKIYADYSPHTLLAPVSSTLATSVVQTFNEDELRAMIDAAHQWNVKVAVHASSPKSINVLVDLVNKMGGGPDSIEHGPMMCLEYDGLPSGGGTTSNASVPGRGKGKKKAKRKMPALEKLARAGEHTTWVPTLAVHYAVMQNTGTKLAKDRWEMCQRTFKMALSLELDDVNKEEKGKEEKDGHDKTMNTAPKRIRMDNIAVGGDTGPFPHGDNALEMVLMRQLGAPWEKVLAWATLGGWKCVRGMEWDGSPGEKRIAHLGHMAGNVFARLSGRMSYGDEVGLVGKEEEEETLELDRGVPFGAIHPGWAADLVVIQGKLDDTPDEFEKALFHGVNFVMKGGIAYRRDGQEVVGLD